MVSASWGLDRDRDRAGALATGGGVAALLAPTELWITVPPRCPGARFPRRLARHPGSKGASSLVELARRSFGERAGPKAIGLLVALGVVGWTGFYIGIASGAISELAEIPVPPIALASAATLWLIHRSGRNIWDAMVALTGVAALLVAGLVFVGIPAEDVSGDVSSLRLPETLGGAGAVVAYAAVFAVRVADFTWDVERDRDVIRAAIVMVLTLVVFVGLGAAIYLRAGAWDFADFTNRTSQPLAAVALLALSAIAPSVSALHSGGLALRTLWNRSVGAGAAVVALVGGVLGGWRFDLMLLPFLGVLGVVIPPVLGVMLVRREGQPPVDAWSAWTAASLAGATASLMGLPGSVAIGLCVSAGFMWMLGRYRQDLTLEVGNVREETT